MKKKYQDGHLTGWRHFYSNVNKVLNPFLNFPGKLPLVCTLLYANYPRIQMFAIYSLSCFTKTKQI